MIICSNSKEWLHVLITEIKQRIGKIRLKLKGNYQVIKFDNVKRTGRPIDFMGFIFMQDKTILRKSILFRSTKFAKRLGRLTTISYSQACSMLSRGGWFKHTKTRYVWEKRIQPNISLTSLKNIVRKNQRRINNENTLERGATFEIA